MLSFLNDLSKFSDMFSTFKTEKAPPRDGATTEKKQAEPKKEEKEPQSPTAGIADEFIQTILDSYLKKR